MPRESQDLLIDVDMPSGIEVATDDDGLPKTVPAEPEKRDDELTKAIETYKRDLESERAVRSAKERDADEFRTQLEAERRARAEAETKLASVSDNAMRSEWAAVNSDYQQIVNAIASAQADGEAAKRELSAAFADENLAPAEKANRIAIAQERIAKSAAERIAYEQGKIGAEAAVRDTKRRIEEAYTKQTTERENPPPREEPKLWATPEEWIADVRKRFGSKPADWLSQHPEYVTDAKLNKKLITFANAFQTLEEKPLDSEDFMSALNAKFFPTKEEPVANGHDDEAEEPRKKTPSAPVSRGSVPGSNGTQKPGKIRLSPDEQGIATQMYPNLSPADAMKRYASNKARAVADGKYDR